MAEALARRSFRSVIGSFVLPFDSPSTPFDLVQVFHNRNRKPNHDDLESFMNRADTAEVPSLTLICLNTSQPKDENYTKSILSNYLSQVYLDIQKNNLPYMKIISPDFDNGFLVSDLAVNETYHITNVNDHITTINDHITNINDHITNAKDYLVAYTLLLPKPVSKGKFEPEVIADKQSDFLTGVETSMTFLHLIVFDNMGTPQPKKTVVGCCFGINYKILDALFPTVPIIPSLNLIPIYPELLIEHLFDNDRAEYVSLMEEQHKAFGQVRSELKSEQDLTSLRTDNFDSLSKKVDELKNMVKHICKHVREVRMHANNFTQHLREKEDKGGNGIGYRSILDRSKTLEKNMNKLLNEVEELYDNARELAVDVRMMKQDQEHRMTRVLIQLTDALRRDSANMKIIAVLTAFFLPFTFMAILLTTPMFKWPDPEEGQIIIWLPFRIYWAASGGMTLLLGCWGVWLLHPKWLFPTSTDAVTVED